jgi:hypothetical protein
LGQRQTGKQKQNAGDDGDLTHNSSPLLQSLETQHPQTRTKAGSCFDAKGTGKVRQTYQ